MLYVIFYTLLTPIRADKPSYVIRILKLHLTHIHVLYNNREIPHTVRSIPLGAHQILNTLKVPSKIPTLANLHTSNFRCRRM